MAKPLMICTQCGGHGHPKRVTKGSMGIELILWICFIVPGVIYSVWRLTSKFDACPYCGAAQSMIPLNSPRGAKLSRELGAS